MGYCENCGCKMYHGACTNCDEELFILEQYDELNIPYPSDETEFMKRARKSIDRINKSQHLYEEG